MLEKTRALKSEAQAQVSALTTSFTGCVILEELFNPLQASISVSVKQGRSDPLDRLVRIKLKVGKVPGPWCSSVRGN